jgi:hypothetical protein
MHLSTKTAVAFCSALLLLIGCAGGGGGSSRTNGATDGTTSGTNVLAVTTRNSDRIAFQDQGGTWVELQKDADGKFRTPVAAADGRYSVALLRDGKVNVFSMTLGDTKNLNLTYNPDNRPSISGQTTNVPAGACLTIGNDLQYIPSVNESFELPFDAPTDVVFSRADATTNVATALLIRRGLTGSVTQNFDYNSPEFTSLTPGTWTAPAIPNQRYLRVMFQTANRGFALLSDATSDSVVDYGAVPASQWQAGDHYAVMFSASANRDVIVATDSLANLNTIDMAEAFTATITKDSAGRHYTLNADPRYAFFRTPVNANYVTYVSADWLSKQGASTYTASTINLPDFQNLTTQLGGVRIYGFVAGGGAAANIEKHFVWTTRGILDYYGTGNGRLIQETVATAQP